MKSFKKIFVAAALTTSTMSQALAESNVDKIAQKVKDQVSKMSVGANVNLVNLDIFDGLSLSAKYRLESEPSYINGYYTRIDKYTLNADLNVGELTNSIKKPLSFNIVKATDVVFARQFKSQSESIKALPYSLKRFPLTAEKASQELEAGDFVAFQTNLDVITGLSSTSLMASHVEGSASLRALLSGQFIVHIYKMPDNKMRIKLMAVRSRGTDGQLKLAINVTTFKMDALNNILEFVPFEFNTRYINQNDLSMLDYVFDLNNPDAAKAYDDLMTAKKVFIKDMKTIDPRISKTDLENKVMMDMSEIEKISAEDVNRAAGHRRIERVFRGTNTSTSYDSNFKISLNIIKFKAGNNYSQNKVLSYDRNNNKQQFLLDTYSSTTSAKSWFDIFGFENQVSMNMLFKADEQWSPQDFVALTAAREIKLASISSKDLEKIKSKIKGIIPTSEYAKIDWKNWDFSRGAITNGYFRHEIFFNPAAINAMPKMDHATVYSTFKNYVTKFGIPSVMPKNTNPNETAATARWEDKFDLDFQFIGSYFATAFDPSQSAQARYQAFLQLKDYEIWQEHGVGYMLELLPKEDLNKLVAYTLVVRANNSDAITHKFGFFDKAELYNSMMYIQNVINNRSIDLRLYTDANGEFSIMQTPTPLK